MVVKKLSLLLMTSNKRGNPLKKQTMKTKTIKAESIKAGQWIKSAYSKVEVLDVEYSKGWIRVKYKTLSGYAPSETWNYRKQQNVRLVID